MKKLPLSYYKNPDVVFLAQDLIGKKLCTFFGGILTSGIITETEAYCGLTDKACHAHLNRRTKRTEIMFGPAGRAYVYLCYGIHHLFNIVTNEKGLADAILIRAIEPVDGIEKMLERRGKTKVDKTLTAGPGNMSAALGITTKNYGEKLDGDFIWIEHSDLKIPEREITKTTRIGVDYAEEDAALPWRFYWNKSRFVSKF